MIANEIFTEEKPYEFLIPLEAAVGVVKRGLRPSQKRIKCERLRRVIAAAWDQDPARRPQWPAILAELEAAREEMCPADGSRPRPRRPSVSMRRSEDRAGASGFLGGHPVGGGGAAAPAKPTIGSLFRKLGSGGGKKGREERSRKAGHQLPMDTEFNA